MNENVKAVNILHKMYAQVGKVIEGINMQRHSVL